MQNRPRFSLLLWLVHLPPLQGCTKPFSLQFPSPRIKLRGRREFSHQFSHGGHIHNTKGLAYRDLPLQHPKDQLQQSVTAWLLAIKWEKESKISTWMEIGGKSRTKVTAQIAIQQSDRKCSSWLMFQEKHTWTLLISQPLRKHMIILFWWSKRPCFYQLLHSLAHSSPVGLRITSSHSQRVQSSYSNTQTHFFRYS